MTLPRTLRFCRCSLLNCACEAGHDLKSVTAAGSLRDIRAGYTRLAGPQAARRLRPAEMKGSAEGCMFQSINLLGFSVFICTSVCISLSIHLPLHL